MIIIFDVDGVLIDVTKSYHYSIKDTVDYFSEVSKPKEELIDIKFSFNINNDWDASIAGILYAKSGLSLEEFKKKFKEFSRNMNDMYTFGQIYGIKLPDYKELVEFFENVYRIHRKKESLIFPHDVLERISKKADILGVITGRPESDLDYSFKHFDLYKYFDYIITEDNIPEPELRKPSSYPLKLFFEKVSYDDPVFYIGDTMADLLMVESFNREECKDIRFILMEHPHNKHIKSELSIKKPDEICDILNSYDYI
ncbi:HAD family hydrolase [Persephonella sp.]